MSAAGRRWLAELAALLDRPSTADLFALLAGGLFAGQARALGNLARQGSIFVAGMYTNVAGVAMLVALVVVTRAWTRAVTNAPVATWPKRWIAGSLGGAGFVLASTIAVPRMGVAPVTVALVCGSLAGTVVVDRLGWGPAGRTPITGARLTGVALAVGATAVGAGGVLGSIEDAVLFPLVVVFGVATTVQRTANGRLTRVTGEPLVASLINFVLGLVTMSALSAGTGASFVLDARLTVALSAAFGVGGVVAAAIAVERTISVVRTGVNIVAGQVGMAFMIDLVAPAPGGHVSLWTVLSVALTLIAAVIAGEPKRHPR